MIRTQITLTEEQASIVKDAAYLDNISVAEVIRRAVDEKYRQGKTGEVSQEKNIWQKLLEVADEAKLKGIKGPKDLSYNLDHYLYGVPKKK